MSLDLLTPTVDKSQVPPLHQKRIVAFINHFLINSCNFLNDFAANCETKFITLERKIQRLEAGLTLIEAKIASIPADTFTTNDDKSNEAATGDETNKQSEIEPTTEEEKELPPLETQTVQACEDVRYEKFFKMVRFGVDPDAVKQKMKAEGFDPSILDTPKLELSDGVKSSS